MKRLFWVLAAGTVIFTSCPALAQTEQDKASLSRQMRVAIRFYELGEDLQAMDRFMEVLTKGDPGERSMANEYINLITQRMNAQGGDFNPKPSAPAAPAAGVRVEAEEKPAVIAGGREAPPVAERKAAPEVVVKAEMPPVPPANVYSRPVPEAGRASKEDKPLPAANRTLMKKEIKAKLRAALDKSLQELKSIEDVRVLMQENGDPRAIGIPSPLLFSNGIAFQKEAAKILDSLTRLVYSLGSTKVYILPEGAAIGDAKVLDMRRTMGISAHLFQAGIAPPRVKVNLLSQQVDMPKALADFKGVVIVFVYDEPLGLVVESALGDDAGPPLSLGVYPQSFRPDKNEGVIIELSVTDPPAGLMSWKFQLLRPSAPGGDLEPLQEIVGGGPVFHQIYWNGRQNYFGPILPPGRYECVLSGTDTKNRQRTLHRWIQIPETAAAPTYAAAERSQATAGATPSSYTSETVSKPAAAPVADLEGAVAAEALVKEAPLRAAKGVEIGKPKVKARPARTKAPAAQAEAPANASVSASPKAEDKPAKPGAGHYDLDFNKSSHQLTPEGERRLATVAETVAYYPLERLKLIGYAHALEPDPAALAERRAKLVAGLLINKYQVEPKKIEFSSKVADEALHRVEVYFAGSVQ
jgi:outer membrane protein OmpA-like peptidoglycan-associated protein